MKWDVFISHANEDKTDFVRPLANELKALGLEVWFDEFSLSLGDSLNRSITKGLSESQFGLVILSKNFFNKEWPKKELDALATREITEGKVILPIWHGVSLYDIQKFSPILADKLAIDSSNGVEYVAKKIFEIIKPIPEQVVKLADKFLKIIKHEIRSPLQGILVQIEFMEKHIDVLDPDKIKRKLHDIKQEAILIDHVIGLIEPYEEIRLNSSYYNLRETVNYCINLLENFADENKIEIKNHVPENVELVGDSYRMINVFYYLLLNSIKYSDKYEKLKTVEIACYVSSDLCHLKFIDNGIGIVESEKEKVFTAFYKGINSQKYFVSGAGLGLFNARRIITAHGGDIRLVSLNKPTIFEISIPLKILNK